MAAEAIKIRATAAKLYKETGDSAIEGYKTMPLDTLKEHIERIKKGTSAPAKGKAAPSANGVKGKPAPAKGKVSSPAKGKSSVSTSAPAASEAQKSSPAKGKAVQGKAKRPTAAAGKGKATSTPRGKAATTARSNAEPSGGWQPGSRGRMPANVTKAQLAEHKRIVAARQAERAQAPRPAVHGNWQPGARGRTPSWATKAQIAEHKRIVTQRAAERSSSPAKGKATPRGKATTAKAPAKATARRGKIQGRSIIDNNAVDWTAESNVGRTGKRAEVLDALRKFKGDKARVFELLEDKARTYYKGRSKHDAERMLVWLIGRVAFDFVVKTGQHEKGSRDGFGTSTKPVNVKRRELREEARKQAEKAARAAKRAGGQAAKGKAPARKTAPAARGKGKTTGARRKVAAAKRGK